MSIFEEIDSSLSNDVKNWIKDLKKEGDLGKLFLLNFFLEARIQKEKCLLFNNAIISYRSDFSNPIDPINRSILENGLFLLLDINNYNHIPSKGLHFTSLRYLIEKGFVDVLNDEKPPKEINIKKPLGTGKLFLWITFEEKIDLNTYNSIDLRNLLGLPATKDDYLYFFPINLEKDLWIPSVFDAFGMPPYKPAGEDLKWGMTRNLIDDSEGVPELLALPLEFLSDSPIGYLANPRIDQLPPNGYIRKRLDEFSNHPENKRWKSLWLM